MHSFGQFERPFYVKSDAGAAGSFSASADQIFVTVSQRVLRDGKEQIWDCVVVHSNTELDGTLRTRVLLCNPDWDEPLEIANVESRLKTDPSSSGILTHIGQRNGNL